MKSPAAKIHTSTAIFAVADVVSTANHYRDVLGFEIGWLWGEPATFGCVQSGAIELFLNKQTTVAPKNEGHQHWFSVDDVDALYSLHRERGAEIIDPIADRPWGMREYVVRDLNGYHLRFAASTKYVRPATARDTIPPAVRIERRLASVEEFLVVYKAIGWTGDAESIGPALVNSLCGVVAIDSSGGADRVVGIARAIGDGSKFIYVQDVAVLPTHQNQKIGTAMLEALMDELRRHYRKGARVYLFTGKPAFYEPFGFKHEDGGMLATL